MVSITPKAGVPPGTVVLPWLKFGVMAFVEVVHVVTQRERRQRTEFGQWMVQPVKCADPELHLLLFMDGECPVDRQVIVEIGRGSHVGIVLAPLGSHRRRRETCSVENLIVGQVMGRVAG